MNITLKTRRLASIKLVKTRKKMLIDLYMNILLNGFDKKGTPPRGVPFTNSFQNLEPRP